MMRKLDGQTIRQVLLEVIEEQANQDSNMQAVTILRETSKRLAIHGDLEFEQALLTYWYDLFRLGYLAWGYNLSNPNPPFCHPTEQGRRTLRNLSRDPANSDGYLSHLVGVAHLNLVAQSYIEEALNTYNSNCFKASAVMVGASAESVILELRDTLVQQMQKLGMSVSKDLQDWRIKRVIDSLKRELDKHKNAMPFELVEAVEAYWPAFIQQIRAARNEAGHPTSISPVTPETVHASLLIFPELAKLASDLSIWIMKNLV